MQAEFRAPRRRCRVYEEYEAPFPVSRSPEERSSFRAELVNQHVLVCVPDHIHKIYKQGYFGKGVLSRARPDHSVSDQWDQHEGLLLPVLTQSRFDQLLGWAESALLAQGLIKEAVSQILQPLSLPVGIEDVRRETGSRENGEGSEADSQAPPNAKRLRLMSGVTLEAGTSCWSEDTRDSSLIPDQLCERSPDLDSDQDSNSDSDLDPESLVPGPGFVLVVSDADGDAATRQVRRNPFCLTEYLQLSLEEAFFLVYSLGCLSVHMQKEPLSIIQLWKKLRSLRPDFISSYAAYHHFRSRGWVPKEGSGAKYGVDLLLYRKGPPFYHASYSVVVEKVDDSFSGSALRPFTWRSLAALGRITANVSKELMLCYIVYPVDLSEAELDSPACLGKLKVQEVIVSRWVSSKERAEQDDI